MPNFDGSQAPADAERRFDGWPGDPEWKDLTQALVQRAPGAWPGALDDFLRTTRARKRSMGPRTCRVFVSHQHLDAQRALRIAWLADQNGFEYWLDVHDPVLRLANNSVLPPPVHSILVAGIIEMALLNCTHVISVQTTHAAGSRWVPYEFGRGKEHLLVSDQAASWFDAGLTPTAAADYLHLGVCVYSDDDVDAWFQSQQHRGCQAAGSSWSGPVPPPLPGPPPRRWPWP
ncbi:MAG: hypothetical protein U1F56_12270 [Rubrivivax sp.]